MEIQQLKTHEPEMKRKKIKWFMGVVNCIGVEERCTNKTK